jgi:hypothetical protein
MSLPRRKRSAGSVETLRETAQSLPEIEDKQIQFEVVDPE